MKQPSLEVALAALAGLVLLALLLQGWWRMRRARQRRMLDALPEGDRIEPGMDVAAAAAVDRIDADGAAFSAHSNGSIDDGARHRADSVSSSDAAGPVPAALRLVPRLPQRLDALIDAIAALSLEAPVSAELALQAMPGTRRIGSKPLLIEGLDADSGTWEPLSLGHRYGELQAGVQLVNRSGALNEIEYSDFVQKVQAYADAVGANADLPDMLEVVARARELDAQTNPLDAVLSVVLRANTVAWSVAYVQQIAARHGFVKGGVPGRLVLPSAEEGAPPLLVLSVDAQAALAALGEDPQASAVRSCTLTLDVPQSPAGAEAFPAWHRSATQLAKDLDATAVDDHGQPITLHAYASIGEELQRLYARLDALDLAAGSPAARRLFS